MADKPVTREEKYLAYLTGDYKGELPKPITRKEKYLYELCLKGIGGEISPEEIKNAVNEYLEKNPVKPGATTEQARQIEQNKTNIASLKEDISNKITKFYASNQGETHLADSDNGKIMDMMLYGKSSQDGTPSPENPVEIKSVVNPTVKVAGKNFYPDGDLIELTKEHVTDFIPVILNKGKICFSFDAFTDTSDGSYLIKAQYFNANKELIGSNGKANTAGNNISHVSFEFDGNNAGNNNEELNLKNVLYVKITFDIYNNTATQITYKNIMVSATDSAYEPYKSVQTVTLPYTLNAIPVSSGGNVIIGEQQYVSDYVDVEKGKLYQKVKRLNLKDVDNEKISHGFHSNGNGYLSISVEAVGKEARLISNRYKSSTWTQESGYLYTPNSNIIVLVDDRFTDNQTAIKLVQDTYVIYTLSSQTEEDLSLEQIESLKSLSTYYPTTNISANSEQLDGYTVFNYPISIKNGWDYVKKQLNGNRDYIYDMDLQSAEAYVNSEYAVTLTELEV